MSNQSTNNRLWTKDFIFITFVNLFMYLIHYMLVVTITEYTIDKYHASESIGGLCRYIYYWYASWTFRFWQNHRSLTT